MQKSNITGVYQNKNTLSWEIDKRVNGIRLRRSLGTKVKIDAEKIAYQLIAQCQKEAESAKIEDIVFNSAAALFLKKHTNPPSYDADVDSLKRIMAHIGQLPISQIHQDHIDLFVTDALKQYKASTINRSISVVNTILKLCARKWRNPVTKKAYLVSQPLLSKITEDDKEKTRPVSKIENDLIMSSMNETYKTLWEFAINTGLREQNQAGLRWEWEVQAPSLNTTVFLIPGRCLASIAAVRQTKILKQLIEEELQSSNHDKSKFIVKNTKNGKDFLLVLNSTAKEIIEKQRGKSDEFVFPSSRGPRYYKFNNRHFREAWRDNNLNEITWHSARATFATNLRMLGVTNEDRKALMGHSDRDVTTGYSWADIGNLIAITEKLTTIDHEGSATFLRIINGN